MYDDEVSVSLPSQEEISSIPASLPLEVMQRLLNQVVRYCKAQTDEVKKNQRTTSELSSRIHSLEQEKEDLQRRLNEAETSMRGHRGTIGELQQQLSKISENQRHFVTESSIAGIQNAMSSMRREYGERLAEYDAKLSADGVIVHEVRSVAKETVATEVETSAIAVKSHLLRVLGDERLRITEMSNRLETCLATAEQARLFVESHRSAIVEAASSLTELRNHPIIASDVAVLRERSKTAEEKAVAAMINVDSLRNDISSRLAAVSAESAEAVAYAKSAVTTETYTIEMSRRDQNVRELEVQLRDEIDARSKRTTSIQLNVENHQELMQQLALELERTSQRLSDLYSVVHDSNGGIAAAASAIAGVGRSVAEEAHRIDGLDRRAIEIERRVGVVEGNNYLVLQAAVNNSHTRIEQLSSRIESLPSESAIISSAKTVAAEVATSEISTQVSLSVAAEMERLHRVVRASIETNVAKSVGEASETLRDAAAAADLRQLVDEMCRALEKIASSMQELSTAVDSDRKGLKTALVTIESVKSTLAHLEGTASSLQRRVGSTETETCVTTELDTIRGLITNLEIKLRDMQADAAPQILPASIVKRGGSQQRGRSPSPSSSKAGNRRQKRVVNGPDELAARGSGKQREEALRYSRTVRGVEEY